MSPLIRTESFSEEESKKSEKIFNPMFKTPAFKKILPSGYVVSESLDLIKIKEMPVYKDDIFIVTPPKCGTTWTQEIVWLMKNNLDLKGAELNQFYRVPFLEIESILPPGPPEHDLYPEGVPMTNENLHWYERNSMEYVRRLQHRPRVIKTHLPISILPDGILDKCKVIFVARNLKDMAVSYYYHYKLMNPGLTFAEFMDVYNDDLVLMTPMMPMVREAWEMKEHKNMFFVTYEEMKSDFDAYLDRLAGFLGATDIGNEEKSLLKGHVDIERFRHNPAVNKSAEIPHDPSLGLAFIRKGAVGDWKNYFTVSMSEDWDERIVDHLEGTDLEMVFEL